MIGFADEKLMALEVGAATGAGYGEKTALRVAQQGKGPSPPGLAINPQRGRTTAVVSILGSFNCCAGSRINYGCSDFR